MSRAVLIAALIGSMLRPAIADPGACSADWQCPHGTTCQAGRCAAPGAGGNGSPAGNPNGGAPNGGAPNGGAPNGGAPNGGANGGANGGPNGGGANGGGTNGGAPNGGAPNGGAPNGGAPNGGANGGGANGGGANGGGANGGGANGGGANGGGAIGGGANGGANGVANGGANGGGANGGGANGGASGGANGGGANAGGPAAGGGTPYGGGAPGPGGPYGTPGAPFSIQLVVSGGTNDIADNAHAMYRPGSKLKLSVIARDANGNVVSGCTPVYEIADASGADGLARGALSGNDVVFLRPGKFSIAASCKENPKISTHGQTNPFNFETSTGTFASCTPGCACANTCDIEAMERAAREPAANGNASHAGPSAGTVLGVIGLLGLVAYGTYYLAAGGGSGQYCWTITASTNGSCPVGDYCSGSQSQCDMDYAMAQSLCVCHVATCSVTFSSSSCGGSAREVPGVAGIHDVQTLVARGFAQPHRVAADTGGAPAATKSGSHLSTRQLVVGAALSAVAIGTTGYLIWRRLHPRPSRVELVPWASPDGAGLTAAGRF